MKKIIYLLILVLFSSSGFGQAIDFSGRWKINREKSRLGQEFTMAPNAIILEQEENTLSVERHASFQGEDFSFTDKFTLDGMECENPGWMETIKKSTAVWAEDSQVLKVTTKIPMQDGGEMIIMETYRMEADTLSIETFASSDYGEMTEVYVFDRESLE